MWSYFLSLLSTKFSFKSECRSQTGWKHNLLVGGHSGFVVAVVEYKWKLSETGLAGVWCSLCRNQSELLVTIWKNKKENLFLKSGKKLRKTVQWVTIRKRWWGGGGGPHAMLQVRHQVIILMHQTFIRVSCLQTSTLSSQRHSLEPD